MKFKVFLTYLIFAIFCINAYGQKALGRDMDYMKTYLGLLGGDYQTKVLDYNHTMLIRHVYLLNSDEILETQYYTIKDGICEQIDIVSPYDEKNWKSTTDYLKKNNYEITEFYYPEIVDGISTVLKTNVYYKPEIRSELYPDKIDAAHYMTITKIEVNNLLNMKVSYFQNTSNFTK